VARLGDVDDTTALRRLLGQLMRRGYGGSAATNAARTALAERGGGSSGVRFR
jgi:regulatory protein